MWLSIDESVVIGVAGVVVDDSDDDMIEFATVDIDVDVVLFVSCFVNGIYENNNVSTRSLVRGRID